MKKNSDKEPVTRGILNEAVDALLEGMDNLFLRFKTELKNELESVKADISFIKHDVQDIKADLSVTPSKKEFNKLKEKVETLSA